MKLCRSNNSAYTNCMKMANVCENELYKKNQHLMICKKKQV